MAVSKEGTWDCVRVEEMRAFPSSQPVQAASPGIHGPRPLPQAPAHAGVRWGVGGGEIREAARMETRSLQATHFWLVSWFSLRVFGPASPAALVQARPCEPSGLLARRPSLWPFLPRRRWSHLPELDARHRSKTKRTKQTSSAFLIRKDAFLTQPWVLDVVASF